MKNEIKNEMKNGKTLHVYMQSKCGQINTF